MKSNLTILVAFILFAQLSIKAQSGDDLTYNQRQVVVNTASTNELTVLKEIESLWPTNPMVYFKRQDQLNEILVSSAETNGAIKKVIEQQIGLVFKKKCPNDIAVVGTYFSTKQNILERIARFTHSSPKLKFAQIMAETLGELRGIIITNYQPIPVSLNIAPPIYPNTPLPTNGLNKGMRFTADGMDPNLIDDPVARDAYLKAIAENNLNNKKNELQISLLPRINRVLTMTFLDYSQKVLSRIRNAEKEADNLSALAHLTSEEHQQLE